MKKFISLLMALALIAAGTGYAYDGEINFRGLEWGMSFAEFEAQNSEPNYSYVVENCPAVSMNELAYGGDTNLKEQTDVVMVKYKDFEQVAGYTPDSVELYFANTSSNSTAFYLAQYCFTIDDGSEMYETIFMKLYSIYGGADTEKANELEGRIGFDYYAIWKGINGSVLSLNLIDLDDSNKTDKIRIVYAWEHGDDILQQNGNQYEKDLEEYNRRFGYASNVDGL